jgi:YbbR domain-containing protein
VQLTFVLPSDMEISNDPREEVEVTLRGSQRALNGLIGRNLVARADVRSYKPGERVVRLSPDRVAIELPEGVSVEKIEPGNVPLRLERRVEREVDVEPRLDGQLPEGYELRGVRVTPRKITVRGPESHVSALDKAHTETISLDGQTESFNVPQVAIDIFDQKVVPLDAVVTVRLEIGEKRVEKGFTGVPVRAASGGEEARPARASVVLRGARSVVEKLRDEDIKILLEQTADGSLVPRLSLPIGMEVSVELISISPSKFSLDR